jgi:5-formyltetrahydrofolate cyclo-ligase
MTKQQLRAVYLEKRKSLTDAEWEYMSASIAEHFFQHVDLSNTSVIHCFLPIEKNKEPNTWLIIDRLKETHPGIFIVLPKVDPGTNKLINFFYSDESTLGINTWGILEPASGFEVETAQIDVVLVPLLVFDSFGNRVGYGKGFYDLFLAECRPDTRRIGISLFESVHRIDDIEPFDQPLTQCITPAGVVQFD